MCVCVCVCVCEREREREREREKERVIRGAGTSKGWNLNCSGNLSMTMDFSKYIFYVS